LLQYIVHGVENFTLAYRLDYGVDEKRGAGDKQTMHSANIGWQPESFVRVVIEANLHQFQDSTTDNYVAWSSWLGVTF